MYWQGHCTTGLARYILTIFIDDKCKKLTSLKLIVRTMWWYHSTKTAKIFWV